MATNRYTRTPEERFLEHINKNGPNGCWEWTGAKSGDGYGSLKINKNVVGVHRFSYEFHKGPIPKNLFVCHTCDNRKCVNPEHLWLGTNQENIDDMLKKGRCIRTKGAMHWKSNLNQDLTKNQIEEIVKKYKPSTTGRKYSNGYSMDRLAREYGISKTSIYFIIKNKKEDK